MGTLSAGNVAWLVAVFAATLVVVRRSWWLGLAAGVCATALGSCSYLNVQERFLTARWGALAALALAVGVRPFRRRPTRVQALAAAVAFVALVSSTWSIVPGLTAQRAAAIAIVLWVAFVVIDRRLDSAAAAAAMAAPLALVAVGLTVSALVVLALDAPTGVYADNLRGLLGSANQLGLLIAITWPSFALVASRRSARPVVAAAAVAIPAAVVALSTSRSGMVGLLLAILLYEAGSRSWRRAAAQIATVVVVFGVLVAWNPQLVPPRLDPANQPVAAPSHPAATAGRADQRTGIFGEGRPPQQSLLTSLLGARNEAWAAAVGLADSRPLTGFGYGSGDRVFDRERSRVHFVYFSAASAPNTNPHSGYVQAIVELGWPGGLLFLSPLLLALARAIRGLAGGSGWSAGERALAAALAVSMFGGVFESIFAAAGGAFSLLVWALAGATLRIRSRPWQPS